MKIPTCLLLLAATLPAHSDPPPNTVPHPVEIRLLHVPQDLLRRCTADRRIEKITGNGGDPASEETVVSALRFLKNTQNANGSWTRNRPVGMTGLSLLCFLGHGETTQSEEFGPTVLKGIQFLVSSAVKHRGKLASDFRDNHWPYEHAVATYALAEAYNLCGIGFQEDIPKLQRAVEVCGQLLIDYQHEGGGWDYAHSQDSARGGDVSITTWHLFALKACKDSGRDFQNLIKCYKKGLDYVARMQQPSGAIGYSSPYWNREQDGTTLAALGASCFQIWKSSASKVSQKAVRFIDKEMQFNWNTPDSDLYGLFFAAQATFRNGGQEWDRFHKRTFPQILKNHASGGFFLTLNKGNIDNIKAVNPSYVPRSPYAVHYRTCLATLTLQTYYRIAVRAPGK